MKFVPIKEVLEKKGKVSVRGWIYRIRKLKNNVFIVLRDGWVILFLTILFFEKRK